MLETNELANGITAIAGELTGDTSAAESPVIDLEVEGAPRRLKPVVRDEAYRIARSVAQRILARARAANHRGDSIRQAALPVDG